VLELRLRSGEIVTFDGRILEVFGSTGRCERLHVVQIEAVRVAEAAGHSSVTFGREGIGVNFAREETPARTRLLAAISEARRAYARLEPPGEGRAAGVIRAGARRR